MQLTGTGLWSAGLRYGDKAEAAEAAAELEDLGYSALWVPDVGGNLFAALENLLAATRRTVIATGILNIWMHEPAETAERHRALETAHGARLLFGLGVSHAPLIDSTTAETYARPLAKMRQYLDDLDALPDPLPVGSRVLAALGPKMRELAGNRSAGVHPYLGTPALTRISREELGPGPLVAPEQAAVLSTDVDHARRVARDHLSRYLVLPNYARSIVRVGFDEADLADGGSDRLVDTLVVHGDEAAIAGRVAEHREAGADHVCVQVLSDDPVALPREEWRRLAPALVAG
ncbi:MAG: LLM class F420-dependent oxidoreductase [Acidimicrobiales bacterium]|nr:LLM class F420-dependent oxidoreductase [Acidimicrobiales bacterium]